jgi:hypothetical protein
LSVISSYRSVYAFVFPFAIVQIVFENIQNADLPKY